MYLNINIYICIHLNVNIHIYVHATKYIYIYILALSLVQGSMTISLECKIITILGVADQMMSVAPAPFWHYTKEICKWISVAMSQWNFTVDINLGFIWFYRTWIIYFLLALTKQNYKIVLLCVVYSQQVAWWIWFLGNSLQIADVICDRYMFLCEFLFKNGVFYQWVYGWPYRPEIEVYLARSLVNGSCKLLSFVVVIPTFINMVVIPNFINNLFLGE